MAPSYAEDMVAYFDLSNWHSFTYSGVKRCGRKYQDTKPLKNLIRAVEGLIRRHFPQAMDVKKNEKNVLASFSTTAHKQDSRYSPSKRLRPSGEAPAVNNLSPNLLNSPTYSWILSDGKLSGACLNPTNPKH